MVLTVHIRDMSHRTWADVRTELIDLAEVIGPGGSGLPRREGQVVGEDEAEDEDFHEDRSRSEDDEQAEIGEDGELEHDDGLQNLRNLQHSEDSLTRIASTGYSNEKENDTASSEGRYLVSRKRISTICELIDLAAWRSPYSVLVLC